MFTPEESAKIVALQEKMERVCPSLDPNAVESILAPISFEEIRQRLTNAQYMYLNYGSWDGKKPTMPPPGMPKPKGKGKGGY